MISPSKIPAQVCGQREPQFSLSYSVYLGFGLKHSFWFVFLSLGCHRNLSLSSHLETLFSSQQPLQSESVGLHVT